MKNIINLLITLPVHLIMGTVSFCFFLLHLKGFSPQGTVLLSLVACITNISGYLLLSFFMLKNYNKRQVIRSTVFFLAAGLLIWVFFLMTEQLGSLFYIYHMAGYTSAIGYVYSLSPIKESLLVELGWLYSILPSLLIFIGFSCRNYLKAKRIFLYMGGIAFSVLAVFLSGYSGRRVETREELATIFPMETGFPLNFAQLRYPTIDPPLPWTYGGFDCCSITVVSWLNFWLSVLIVFLVFVLLFELIMWLINRSEQRYSSTANS